MRRTAITTARLQLRAMAAGDLTLFRDLYSDVRTMRHIGRPFTPEQVEANLRATVAAAREPLGPRFFVIVERRRRHAVGLCSLQAVCVPERSVEIGIMLRRDACRKQLASEALFGLTAAALRTLPVDTVWAQYRKTNRSAAQLCNTLGFCEMNDWRPRGASLRLCVKGVRRSALQSNQPQGAVPMSNVIGFLESAGRDAVLRHASREQLLQAMQREEVEPALQAALMQPERMAIDGLMGVRETMYCSNKSIAPPKPKQTPAKKAPAKAPPKKAPAKKAPKK